MKINELLWGSESSEFIWELIIRSGIMFTIMMVVLQIAGKRGIKQLSIFEMIMIIALGSAAGDPMLYKDAGILSALVVFTVVMAIYRLMVFLITRFEKAEFLLEGKPEYIIQNGVSTDRSLKNHKLGIDEFFSELRSLNVEHLGQLKTVVLETNGLISVLFFKDEEVKYGLPIWPQEYNAKSEKLVVGRHMACARCGQTLKAETETAACPRCQHTQWVEAKNSVRVM